MEGDRMIEPFTADEVIRRWRLPRSWRNYHRGSTNWLHYQEIYERWLAGTSQASIARELGITRAWVSQIVRRQAYYWSQQ